MTIQVEEKLPSKLFAIELAYEGSGFQGWQIQPDLRTVQGELKLRCERITDQPVSLVGAGRTDAGVHARASLNSFTAQTHRTAEQLFRGLRRTLPDDIHIRRVDLRELDFSARFSALARAYEYRIHRGKDPFRRAQAWCTGYRLDVMKMEQALQVLKGRLDCRGFCVTGSLPPAAWCEFQRVSLTEDGPELLFQVKCDRFLHSMVRSLAGTLHDIGRGRFGPERMEEILVTGRRELCGQTAPPQGLYLDHVDYPGFRTGGVEGFSEGKQSDDRKGSQ